MINSSISEFYFYLKASKCLTLHLLRSTAWLSWHLVCLVNERLVDVGNDTTTGDGGLQAGEQQQL
jgi:hypothetical protein